MRNFNFVRRHFFAGLLVILPLSVIGWLLFAVFQVIWQMHEFVPEAWKPEHYLGDTSAAFLINLSSTALLILIFAMGVAFLGWASKHYLGEKILEVIGSLIQRIPVIRSVYSALDQLLRAVAAGGGSQFRRVVYLEFPKTGVWTLGFVTGFAPAPENISRKFLSVYVPTTPNPTSGFYLVVPEDEVRDAHMSVEEAFKTLLSLGIAQASDSHSSRSVG
jgi:uncharacterized membrane protein